MPTFSNIDGEESATVTFTVAAVSLSRNSSAELQEILCIGDPDVASSLGVARVTNAAPASTNAGLNVRILSGPSSLADFAVRAVLPSTGTDNPVSAAQASTVWAVQVDGRVRAQNSTIGDFLASVQQNSTVWQVQVGGYSTIAAISSVSGVVAVAPATSNATAFYAVRFSNGSTYTDYSTTAQVSSVGGVVTVQQNSTVWNVQVEKCSSLSTGHVTVDTGSIRVHQSTIGDLLASVQQNSTVWQVQAKILDSSAVAFGGSTTRPTTGAQAQVMRIVLNDLQSTCFSTMGNNSTSSTIVSSVASQKVKVFAYSITSTAQAVNTLSFASSLANPIWQVQMQSVSSGITGANLAVSPPAWLFATAAAEPLVFKITGSTGSYHLSFSYFIEA